MIELIGSQNSKDFVVAQTLATPSVYLDHCAIRKISESPDMSVQLVDVLKKKNGTLAVSIFNGYEFSGLTDLIQAQKADDLLKQVWPNLYFIDVNPIMVSYNEKSWGHVDVLIPGRRPSDDLAQLEWVKGSSHWTVNDSIGEVLTVRWPKDGLFVHAVKQRASFQVFLADFKRAGREVMDMFRNQVKSDKDFLAAHRQAIHGFAKYGYKGRLSTAAVMTQMMIEWEATVADFADNDMTDFLHACVPSAHCDLVVLDGRWRHIVDRVRQFLSRRKVRHSLAAVFAASPNGLKQFFSALEATRPSAQPGIVLSELAAAASKYAARQAN